MTPTTAHIARREAEIWAREVAEDRDTLFLDTETTGLGYGAEIVDIAVLDADGNALLETLVRPNRPIPHEASRVHGITDDLVIHAPSWPDVHRELTGLIDDARRIVIYNKQFDVGIMRQVSQEARLPELRARWECAMEAFAKYRGEWNFKYGNWRWHKLDNAARMFGVYAPQAHRARADAALCRQVVHGMAGMIVRR